MPELQFDYRAVIDGTFLKNWVSKMTKPVLQAQYLDLDTESTLPLHYMGAQETVCELIQQPSTLATT